VTLLDTLKRWLGLAPKPSEPAPEVIEQTLPNGRVALTDQKGNFLKFVN
jgi:hypothetical protein